MSFYVRARARLAKTLSPRPWEYPSAQSQTSLNEDDAYEIGVEAYLYFCPLVLMDLTRRQFINRTPMNRFLHSRAFPPADFRGVVRPNWDTLVSVVWLDLRNQPQVISVPDTDGRYYLLQMLDMWTDTFASIGKRTTGTVCGHFAVVPPGWRGTIPAGVHRIEAPTQYVWVIGRTQTNGPTDFEAVHKIQNGFQITPLSRYQTAMQRFRVAFDPSLDMKTPPLFQIMSMTAPQFLGCASRLLQTTPPHLADQPVLERIRRIGSEPGKRFDFEQFSPAVKKSLEQALVEVWKGNHTKRATRHNSPNGWQIHLHSIGAYGVNYVNRAVVAVSGLGANLPEDSVYPTTTVDSDGNVLHGSNQYRLHFDKEELPPVNAFWSVTLYDSNGFQVANQLNRFALGDRDPLQFNFDGSLTIIVQNTSPGPELESNWIPAPTEVFNLQMRLYGPTSTVLNGTWVPPAVKKIIER